MGNTTNPERWDAQQRLAFIEETAFWRGWIRRADLEQTFRISLSQASADLQAYLGKFPANLWYDLKAKRYFAAETMQCTLIKPNLGRAISRFLGHETKDRDVLDRVAFIDLPQRTPNPAVIRQVFRAVLDQKAVNVHYYSLHSMTASWRWISPHAFAHDGYRWHTRAYCHEDQVYKDFVLGRITEARPPEKREARQVSDDEWNTWTKIHLRPDRRLDAIQRKAIEFDYDMTDGVVTLDVRRSMLDYTLSYLRVSAKSFPQQLELSD